MIDLVGMMDDGKYHFFKILPPEQPVRSIQVQLTVATPCGMKLHYMPLLSPAGPTCPECVRLGQLSRKNGTLHWSPPADERGSPLPR